MVSPSSTAFPICEAMNRLIRGIFAIALLILCCACLALGLYEVWLRVRGRSPIQELYTPSPTSIARFLPDLDLERGGVRLRTNSMGIREHDDVPPHTPTILVFGDSNVAGLFLDYPETLTEQLEARLADQGIETQALNFGVPGYGPDQNVALFKEVMDAPQRGELPLGSPVAAVLHVFADNDCGDLFKNNLLRTSGLNNSGGYALFPAHPDPALNWPNLAYSRYPALAAGLEALLRIVGVPRSRVLFALAPNDFYYRRFVHECHQGHREFCMEPGVRAFVREGLEYGRYIRESYDKGRYTTWIEDYYDFDLALDAPGSRKKRTVAMLAALFTMFRDISLERGIRPLVLIQPSEYDTAPTNAVTPELLTDYSGQNGLGYSPANLSNIFVQAANHAKIEVIDLFPLFSHSSGNYYTLEERGYDNHWNATGVGRAAQVLAQTMAQTLAQPPATSE